MAYCVKIFIYTTVYSKMKKTPKKPNSLPTYPETEE